MFRARLRLLLAGLDRGAGSGSRRENPDEDRLTVRRVADGDAAALAALYDGYSRQVYSMAVRVLQDQTEAEDIVQEVFAQAWRQASRFDGSRGTVGAWLLNMTRSRAIDRVRSRRSRPDSTPTDERMLGTLTDAALRPDQAVGAAQSAARLRAAMGALPLLQRLAIELAYFEGLTQAEIAERLEQPLGTVKTRIRLGLLKLRDLMTGPAQ
jgi:RNA polymerase sigma-70 factor (ECF subfamily)